MEVRRQCQQYLGNVIKNDIQQNNACRKMPQPKNPKIGVKSLPARFKSFSKAGGAEHFIIMFGDALPAEKSAALRTTGHCLAKHMIYTALVSEVRHFQV
jgi:hypothetical protein